MRRTERMAAALVPHIILHMEDASAEVDVVILVECADSESAVTKTRAELGMFSSARSKLVHTGIVLSMTRAVR